MKDYEPFLTRTAVTGGRKAILFCLLTCVFEFSLLTASGPVRNSLSLEMEGMTASGLVDNSLGLESMTASGPVDNSFGR